MRDEDQDDRLDEAHAEPLQRQEQQHVEGGDDDGPEEGDVGRARLMATALPSTSARSQAAMAISQAIQFGQRVQRG